MYNNILQIDPFTNRVELSCGQVFQIIAFSLTIAPLRLLCVMVIILFGWVLARIGLLGTTDEELTNCPLMGWRKKLQRLLYALGEAISFCTGLHNVTTVGEPVRIRKHIKINLIPWESFSMAINRF